MLSPDVIAAFLTGVASILGGVFAIKRARNQERALCEMRIREMTNAYEVGLERGLRMEERDA